MLFDPKFRPTLTVEEAAAVLSISRSLAYEAVRTGEIPSIRVGRRVLVPTAALNRLIGADSPLAEEVRGSVPILPGPVLVVGETTARRVRTSRPQRGRAT
jgi:excisionase family DNA binding protein